MNKSLVHALFAALLCAVFLLPACSETTNPEISVYAPLGNASLRDGASSAYGAGVAQQAQDSAGLRVEDYLGREVFLHKPAQRIVALAPHIVENLYSAGLGERIVATVNHADYPEAAKAIPRIGGFSHFSREAILQNRPDLVIGWAAGYEGFSSLLAQLVDLGVPVYADDPRELSDIARSIRDFARLGGVAEPEALLDEALYRPLSALREQHAAASTEPVAVFYEIWHQPLQTLNGRHIVSQAIETCGGRNVFADAPVLAPKISLEAVLAANPEVIIASASSDERPATLDNWQRWTNLDAVNNDQLYHVHGDLLSRHTLRMVDGVAQLCDHIARARSVRGQGESIAASGVPGSDGQAAGFASKAQ